MISQINIYSIPINFLGKIAIISRPRGDELLEESILFLQEMSIEIVVSALTHEESKELQT